MILMLNCSYKGEKANSQYFLKLLKKELELPMAGALDSSCEIVQIREVLKGKVEQFAEKLHETDALVIAAPLYVDGLPAQAVKLLEMLLENYKSQFPELPVYVVSNLGFYEAKQIQHLFAIVENWCQRMGMIYGGGLAIGAGPMLCALKKLPLKSGLNKHIGQGFEQLAKAVATGSSMENYYTKTMIPRVVYQKAAHMTFGKTAKANGLKVEDVK